MNYATIDIGTNTVLLLISNYPPLKILCDEARITRLGEGLHQQPFFIEKAQERTLAALKTYKEICTKQKVVTIIAVGTAAFRKAKNAPQFIDRVEKETGIRIQIISGEEEARLSYLSAKKDFSTYENLFVLDIGGGSTEIISKEGGVSLDLGAVVMTERIVRHDPPTEEEVQQMVEEVDQKVGTIQKPHTHNIPTLVGLAGSVTTLSAIKQKLAIWDGSKVQGSRLTQEDIQTMIDLFRKTTVAEKSKIPGMVAGREDTILVGSLILQKVMEKLGVSEVIVSDRGLRYGLLYGSTSSPCPL